MMHVFERAGLGVAPFRFVGCAVVTYQASPDSPIQPGGSCDYCGTGISLFCYIKDANGVQFKVGSDCVLKTDDKRIIDPVKAEINKRKLEARHAKEEALIQEGQALLNDADVIARLSSLPHPNQWQAEKGKTLQDWASFMFLNAGNKGKLEATKVLKKYRDNAPSQEELAAHSQVIAEAKARQSAKEQAEQDEANRREQAAKARREAYKPVIDVLIRSGNGGFVNSMIEHLNNFPLSMLSSRQYDILADIYGKSGGRAGSKGYRAKQEELENLCVEVK